MKTIKLKIMNTIDLNYELKTYNSVVHFAYNRFHDDSVKEKDVRSQVNQLFKGKLNSWLLQCAIKDWKNAFLEIKNSKVKYRVLLNDIIQNAVFSKYNKKSKVITYSFV